MAQINLHIGKDNGVRFFCAKTGGPILEVESNIPRDSRFWLTFKQTDKSPWFILELFFDVESRNLAGFTLTSARDAVSEPMVSVAPVVDGYVTIDQSISKTYTDVYVDSKVYFGDDFIEIYLPNFNATKISVRMGNFIVHTDGRYITGLKFMGIDAKTMNNIKFDAVCFSPSISSIIGYFLDENEWKK